MSHRTITVKGYLGGDREITKAQFVDTWKNHARELLNIDPTNAEWYDFVYDVVAKVDAKAGKEFEDTFARQHSLEMV